MWTAALEARLEQLVADGWAYAAIARTLGVTKNAALARARKLGFKPRADVPQTKAQRGRQEATRLARTARPVATFPTGGCLFGFGHPGTREFRFCVAPGSPWCAEHRAVVYVTHRKDSAG